MIATGGRACFDTIDCVAWGNYTNVVGDGAMDVEVGESVNVCFETRADGFKIPQFARAAR